MQTIEIDQYCRRSTLYSFDPRVKLVGTLALVVAMSFLRNITALLVALAFVVALLLVSRLPFAHMARIFSLSVPFILVASVALYFTSGPGPALAMALRIAASVLLLLLLVTTTPFFDVLWALRWFRVPYVFCSLLLFTYRYIFVMLEELERMNMARRSRGFSLGGSLLSREVFRTISFTAGMVLVRSYDRSKNIYSGLVARGYKGEVRTVRRPRFRARDGAYIAAFAAVTVVVASIQWGLVSWTA
jgi:cobalt/nickel transport system permease protein